ncbi:MAG: hypothetical protein IJZ23_05470 [Roseburia sp.]|nr:hypothetical protein [Roseburia sp.]
MHRKFIIGSRFVCVFGILSALVLAVISLFDIDVTLPAPIAYIMLFSLMLTVLCLLIGFVLDVMSHLIRKDMSAIMWLLIFTIVISVIQIVFGTVNGQALNYTEVLYNAFLVAAGLRGLWYIIGIRAYEIK